MRISGLRLVVLFALAAPINAHAGGADPATGRMCHGAGNPAVRSQSPLATATIDYGLRHSPSMQALVDALQDTDVIAYIDSDLKPLGDVWGHVSFVAKTRQCRYVRVVITAHLNLTRAAALLAHELQHVLEIAAHPGVVDEATLSAMYKTYGEAGRYANAYDSAEAKEIGARVEAEISGGAAASATSSPAERGR